MSNVYRKRRFYVVNQNSSFAVQFNLKMLWTPENYISREENNIDTPEHFRKILELRKGDILFGMLNGNILSVAQVCSDEWEKCKMPEEFKEVKGSEKWTADGYKVDLYVQLVFFQVNIKDPKYRDRLMNYPNSILDSNGDLKRQSYIHRVPVEVGRDLLKDIIQNNMYHFGSLTSLQEAAEGINVE